MSDNEAQTLGEYLRDVGNYLREIEQQSASDTLRAAQKGVNRGKTSTKDPEEKKK